MKNLTQPQRDLRDSTYGVILKYLLLLLVIISLVPAFSPAKSALQQKIEQERIKSQEIQARLHQKRYELHNVTIHVNDLQGQLDRTNAAIATVDVRIGSLDAQERSTQSRLAWNTIQLHAAQKSLQRHNDALKRRLVAIYENGNLGYLNVLLTARSFSEFAERWEDLRLLIAANERAVRDRKAAAAKVGAVQANLERTQLELQQEQQAQDQARSQLAGLAEERRNLVDAADAQRHGVAIEVAQMEELSAAEELRLETLIQALQQQLAAERAAQRRAAGIAGVIPPPSEGAPSALSWPARGPITSPFGPRRNPFTGGADFHPGIDIGIDTGTTVSAAAAGTVIMAQWYGGYGNYILIDHGGGISTGYGHLSRFYVSVGQQVQRGQAIAASGSTGYSTGPHLHFEVRRNGKPIDPIPWLR